MTTVNPATKKASEGKVDLDATRERLVKLGLLRAAEGLERRLSEAVVREPLILRVRGRHLLRTSLT
jgi:hypothetical protein